MESPKGNFLKILNNDDIEKLYETSLNSYCSDNTNENINNEIPINKTNYQLYKQKFFNAIENKLTIDGIAAGCCHVITIHQIIDSN
jgi:hypothetical protein